MNDDSDYITLHRKWRTACEESQSNLDRALEAERQIVELRAALDAAEQRGRDAERERWTGKRSQINDLICSCGHWYTLHASGACKTCGCADPFSVILGGGGE